MVGPAIFAIFGMFQFFLVLLIILIGFFINRKIAGIALGVYFATLLLPPFMAWASYSARLAWNDGYHERAFDDFIYRVKLDEERGFTLAGKRQAFRRDQLRFAYRSAAIRPVDFWIQDIDGDALLPSGCPIIGHRYGLNEVSSDCSPLDDRSLYSGFVFETDLDAPIQTQLACRDPHEWEKDQTQNCGAYFQFGRFQIGAWISLNDPNRWPEIATQLSRIVEENFVIEDIQP